MKVRPPLMGQPAGVRPLLVEIAGSVVELQSSAGYRGSYPYTLPRYVLYEAALQRMYESATSELNGVVRDACCFGGGSLCLQSAFAIAVFVICLHSTEAAEMGRLDIVPSVVCFVSFSRRIGRI